jgi:hypothetical protein
VKIVVLTLVGVGCASSVEPLATAEPGVVFAYPGDKQLDVPLGSRVVVTFSEPVAKAALGACTATTGAFCLVGPGGPVDAAAVVSEDGKTVSFEAPPLLAATSYDVIVRPALAPFATNLPEGGSLLRFTTRARQPRSASPALIAVNGAPPDTPEAFRPTVETSTIRLVFSEPLDPRTITLAPGAFELIDAETGVGVPATIVGDGIHVAIDPTEDLLPNASYEVHVGGGVLRDLGNQAVAARTITLTTHDSNARNPIPQILRTRQDGDPGPAATRSGAGRNVVVIDKPLIGREQARALPAALRAELADPKALAELGNPMAFTIRKGQRMQLSGLDIKLGATIPTGLSTGDITIEFLTDANGRMYRNPFQPATQRPENLRSPLYVDLTMDIAIYAGDPIGTAVMTQTVLGLQATGTAIATDGVLAIEAVASMELGLLGATEAPSNFVLELITDPKATVPVDNEPPGIVTTEPADFTTTHAPGDGIELVFTEPIDLTQARDGGIVLQNEAGQQVQAVIESQGAGVVIRPLIRLPYSADFRVLMSGVSDVAGNIMPDAELVFATPTLIGTNVPPLLTSLHPGAACALTGGNAVSPGRCTNGQADDEPYQLFTLAANEPIEATFSQPLNQSTLVLGTTVRVDAIDGGVTPVPGALVRRDRGLAFFPDAPWVEGQRYRLTLVSGPNNTCDANEICGALSAARPASFDPLQSSKADSGGGPNLVMEFVGAKASTAVYMVVRAAPFTDENGNGSVDGAEDLRDENRAALRITGTGGVVSEARFDMADCIPGGPQNGCMYLSGSMPVQLEELATDCRLPDNTSVEACIPVQMSPVNMFGTSLKIDAEGIGFLPISTATETNVLRVREPPGGVRAFIVDAGDGTAKLITALTLYMDAPDMSVDLSAHDMHSKPISLVLEGPVSFQPDGRITISLENRDDVPVRVNLTTLGFLDGRVDMMLDKGAMKMQLASRPPRGVEP